MKVWNRNTIDLKKYKNSKTVIHCDTEEKANDLLKYLDEQGIIWRIGDRLTENNYWEDYKERTCYNCNYENVLTYGSKYTYKHNIIEWEIVDENNKQIEMQLLLENIRSKFDKKIFVVYGLDCNQYNKNTIKKLIETYPNYMFISPEYCFGYLEGKIDCQIKIDMQCELLKMCDEMWILNEFYRGSKDTMIERECALNNNIPVYNVKLYNN